MANIDTGQIVVHDNGYTIERADDEALISLEFVHGADSRGFFIAGGIIVIGTIPNTVRYRVTGWDHDRNALTVKKLED